MVLSSPRKALTLEKAGQMKFSFPFLTFDIYPDLSLIDFWRSLSMIYLNTPFLSLFCQVERLGVQISEISAELADLWALSLRAEEPTKQTL